MLYLSIIIFLKAFWNYQSFVFKCNHSHSNQLFALCHVGLDIIGGVIEQQPWQTFTFPAFSTFMKDIQIAMSSSLSQVTSS